MIISILDANSDLELLRERNAFLEKKNKELDAFFHQVAHDLRGSVTTLVSLDSLLRRQITDPSAISLMDLSFGQITRINKILDELLVLAKIGHLDESSRLINLEQTVDECLTTLSSMDNFEWVRIEKQIDFDAPYKAPWILMNTIFQNLIENGIKYANPESADPFVRIEITEDHSLLKIRVMDNGIGMSKEHGDNIFEMFYRATTNTGGSGLGLYILSRAVEQLGGTVDVQSEISEGSVFTVLLPLG